MQWIEISVKVTHEAVEATADIMNSLGAGGVVIDDPLLLNCLRASGAWELCAIPEQEHTEIVTVTAYLPDDSELTAKLGALHEALEEVEKRIGACRYGDVCFRSLTEKDWANEWKRFFHTTKVGQRLVIKPTWEEYTPLDNELVINIDPGMAFGTGTHHTTNMCMQCLERMVKPGMTVFDVGTGSGILAMAAALLGASSVKAVDIDTTAVKVAKENIALNQLEKCIEVRQGDLLHGTEGCADIIIANIIADVILLVMPVIQGKLKAGGVFLTSGIIEGRLEDILKAAPKHGLKVLEVQRRGEWAAVIMGREEDHA